MKDWRRFRADRFRLQDCLTAVCRTGRHILFLALLPVCLSAAPAVAGDLPDTPANRYLAAEAYLKLYSLDTMIDDTTEEILKVMLPQYHETFRETMKLLMDRINLEELIIISLVKHFTVKEINAMTEFYGSPEGQSIIKKIPIYMKEIIPPMMSIIPEAIKSVEEKMRG